MGIIIQAKQIESTALVGLLQELGKHFKFLVVSDWQDIHFVKFDSTHPAIPDSDRGRAFGENSELRWRRDEDHTHFICRWISADGTPSSGAGWETLPDDELNGLKPEPLQYLLWGEPLFDASNKWMREKNDERIWYQARIPKKLTYPIDSDLAKWWKDNPKDDTPLVLKVCEYQQNGQTMFERFIGLERYESRKEAKS